MEQLAHLRREQDLRHAAREQRPHRNRFHQHGIDTFFGRVEYVQKSAQGLVVGDESEAAYGTRYLQGYAVFLRLRPDRMRTEHGKVTGAM